MEVPSKRWWLAACVALAAAAAGLLRAPSGRAGGGGEAAARFVDPQTCFACHERQQAEWRGSHHDLAMQEATPETVRGDFGGATFDRFGVATRFFRRDGRFFVRTEGADGRLADFEVKYTFGFEPLQQYLVALDGGRLQALTICWDTNNKRWYDLHDEPIAPTDELHWTGLRFNWNYSCAECHSTNLSKNYDLEHDTYRTTWSEIDVGCQACHGPGSKHVAWGRAVEATDAEYALDDEKGLVMRFRGDDPRGQVDACARCHARRVPLRAEYEYGRPFLDQYMPALLEERLYHADGQIKDEVYVYGSFLQSRMFREGVRCTDCHNPHSAKIRLQGNTMCQRCHQSEPPPQFPTLKKKEYDTKEHHFHEPGTPGSRCVACHMPTTTYMGVDARLDHGFKVPRPDLTLTLGVPNACDRCHADRGTQWSADAVARWYPREEPRPPHFAEAFAAAWKGDAGAGPALRAVARDGEQPAFVRAGALRLLPRFGDVETLAASLADPDPLVRVAAAGGFTRLPPRVQLEALAPLLRDPVRAVRLEAARILTEVPAARFRAAQREAFEAALEEYRQRQVALADRPGAHLNLGVMHANLGELREAESSYRRAIAMDPRFLPARFNLANLYNAQGRNREAEEQLREIARMAPGHGEGHYSLGLLLAEENRLAEAAEALADAARLLPGRARVRYNLGLALQRLGRTGEAEAALLAAEKLAPRDADVLEALALLYAQRRAWKRGLLYARRLAALVEGPGPRRLVARLEAELAR